MSRITCVKGIKEADNCQQCGWYRGNRIVVPEHGSGTLFIGGKMKELEKQYNPKEVESKTYKFWMDHNYFHAVCDPEKSAYCASQLLVDDQVVPCGHHYDHGGFKSDRPQRDHADHSFIQSDSCHSDMGPVF